MVAQCLEATCKYHAWRYSLAGELSYVQQEEEFFGLDKADCGLKPVRRTRSPPITLRSIAMALLPAERFGMNDLPDPSGTCCNDDVAGPGLVPGRGLLPAARPRLWRRLPRLGRRAEGLTPVGGVSATGAGRGGRRGRRATPRR